MLRAQGPAPPPSRWVGTNARIRAADRGPLFFLIYFADLRLTAQTAEKKRSIQTVCKHDAAGRKLVGVLFCLSFSISCCFRRVKRRDKSRVRTRLHHRDALITHLCVNSRPTITKVSLFHRKESQVCQERGLITSLILTKLHYRWYKTYFHYMFAICVATKKTNLWCVHE